MSKDPGDVAGILDAIRNFKQSPNASNQPKIMYRSDTRGRTYQMMLSSGSYAIHVMTHLDELLDVSPTQRCIHPWRKTVDKFFDMVDRHINTGKWEA